MSYLAIVLSQRLHFGSICSIVKSDISFCVSYNHSFLQVVKLKGGNLEWSDIHVNSFNISVQRTPNFNLIACWSKQA